MRALLLILLFLAASAWADVPSTARVLAGKTPTALEHSWVRGEAWERYREDTNTAWAQLRATRFVQINDWRRSELPEGCPGGTLYYPFSGPDFLNAYLFFPDCDTYIMLGLERPGHAPKLDPRKFEKLLSELDTARAVLVERNYFITGRLVQHLSESTELRGVTPIILMTMSLLELEPRAVDGAPDGVKITFTDRGRTKTLYYFSFNATDSGISASPGTFNKLTKLPYSTVMLKSASYLLHDSQFKLMLGTVLRGQLILQDDTGVPYDVLRGKGYEVTLYGKYNVPVKDFNYGFQPSLDRAYQRRVTPTLMFPYGYHWQDGESGVLVARK